VRPSVACGDQVAMPAQHRGRAHNEPDLVQHDAGQAVQQSGQERPIGTGVGRGVGGSGSTSGFGRAAADASLRPADLVEALHARFGVRVHPRSVERGLARRRQARGEPKSG
jgi:hypothetical protein